MTGYWRDNVVCLSVHLSVHLSLMLCIVIKRYILQQKCLNKWIGSAVLGSWFYSYPSLHISYQAMAIPWNSPPPITKFKISTSSIATDIQDNAVRSAISTTLRLLCVIRGRTTVDRCSVKRHLDMGPISLARLSQHILSIWVGKFRKWNSSLSPIVPSPLTPLSGPFFSYLYQIKTSKASCSLPFPWSFSSPPFLLFPSNETKDLGVLWASIIGAAHANAFRYCKDNTLLWSNFAQFLENFTLHF